MFVLDPRSRSFSVVPVDAYRRRRDTVRLAGHLLRDTLFVLTITGISLLLAACGDSRATELKAADDVYVTGDYEIAATLYEKLLSEEPNRFPKAYFNLANSYDNLASRRGEADKDALISKAARNYQSAADKFFATGTPDGRKSARGAWSYLVALYGPEKGDDPIKATAAAQQAIQQDATDIGAYVSLAGVYEGIGEYDKAEGALVEAARASPGDPRVEDSLVGHYLRTGDWDKADRAERALRGRAAGEPDRADVHIAIASTYYDDLLFRKLDRFQKKEAVQQGLDAINRAIQITPNAWAAVYYQSSLLGFQATLEDDPATRDALGTRAKALQERARELLSDEADTFLK